VRLDGVEISDWNHDEIGPQMGYVPQEIEFFEGTVAENIARLGQIDPDKVVEAAQLIGMHDIILSFPQGYDTELGETGFALSGGQRQRLAIARAFYGTPKYIVMDEPNANLDELGESVLAQAVDILKKKGCAIIITTHRPRLVSVVNNLLVLRAGRQVGFGPADDMINAVRNLQVVGNDQSNADAQEVEHNEVAVLKEGTNDTPVENRPDIPSDPLASVEAKNSSHAISDPRPNNPEALNEQSDFSQPISAREEETAEAVAPQAVSQESTHVSTQRQALTEQVATQIQDPVPIKEVVEISDDAAQALGLAELLGSDAEHQDANPHEQVNEANKPQAGTAV
jgi:ABC-type multidrug transport system ATPase subunit